MLDNRILQEFLKLTAFDAESFSEREIANYLENTLKEIGLEVQRDEHANLYAYLEGDADSETILFSSHMDTVSPGVGKRAIVHEDGTITSDGTTVLGADDVSGIVSILEALRQIKENNLKHSNIEVLFTVAEEPYCAGSRLVDYSKIKADYGYVLDLVGPVGTAAVAAPSIIEVKVNVRGKAAHAGFAPEEGINALNITVKALAQIPTGHTSSDTTVNFGLIQGGTGKNIVPEMISLDGEIRSLDHSKALAEVEKIKKVFTATAAEYGANAEIEVIEHIKAYNIDTNEKVVSRFKSAAKGVMRCISPDCITTFGGSDANRLNEHNIPTIVLACAMERCHTTQEYTTIEELQKSAELTLQLMTI